jgi:hypothetical protein
MESFDHWMMNVLFQDRLKFFAIPNLSVEKGGVHRDRDHRNGCVWIELPDHPPIMFGSELNQRVVAAKIEPFLQRISARDWDGLKKPLAEFKTIMDKEYKIAVPSSEELIAIIHTNSRWVFKCYFANLLSFPVIIEKRATMEVTDVDGTKRKENLELLVQDTERKNEASSVFDLGLAEARHPLVIKPATDADFGFLTTRTQSEMPFGSAIREVFDRQQAKVIVRITARTAGIRKQKVCASTAVSFEETVFKEPS